MPIGGGGASWWPVVLIGGGGASWWPVVLIGGGGASWWLVVLIGGGGVSWWLVVPPGGGGGSWWLVCLSVAVAVPGGGGGLILPTDPRQADRRKSFQGGGADLRESLFRDFFYDCISLNINYLFSPRGRVV